MRTTVISVPFHVKLFNSVLFDGTPEHLGHLEAVKVGEPGLAIKRFWRLAAMVFDDATTDDAGGDFLVDEEACLD